MVGDGSVLVGDGYGAAAVVVVVALVAAVGVFLAYEAQAMDVVGFLSVGGGAD